MYVDVRVLRLSLDKLPLRTTSFTLTDSVTALGLGETLGVPIAPSTHQRRLYRLEQLDEIIGRYGMPNSSTAQNYDGHQRHVLDHYVEVQLWSDEPVVDKF